MSVWFHPVALQLRVVAVLGKSGLSCVHKPTGCPAELPSKRAMLKAVAADFSKIDLASCTVLQKSSSSATVRSIKRGTPRLGSTTACSGAIGFNPVTATDEPPGGASSTCVERRHAHPAMNLPHKDID
eukprot:3553220-Amphidinium_carterae.1